MKFILKLKTPVGCEIISTLNLSYKLVMLMIEKYARTKYQAYASIVRVTEKHCKKNLNKNIGKGSSGSFRANLKLAKL